MKICDFCGWEGDDVEEFAEGNETACLCMACQIAVNIFGESKSVGKMHPARLVPLLRAVVAQSVGAIVASTLTYLAEATGQDEFSQVVDRLREKESTDPN